MVVRVTCAIAMFVVSLVINQKFEWKFFFLLLFFTFMRAHCDTEMLFSQPSQRRMEWRWDDFTLTGKVRFEK